MAVYGRRFLLDQINLSQRRRCREQYCAAQIPPGFAEIVSDDFPVLHATVSLPSNVSYHTKAAVDASLFGSEQGHENIRDEIAEEMHRDCDPKVSLVDVDTRKNCAGQHRNDNSRLTLAVM